MLDGWLGITEWWWLSVAAALTGSQMFDALTTWWAMSFHMREDGKPWREGHSLWADIINSNPRMVFVGAAVQSFVYFTVVLFIYLVLINVSFSIFGISAQTIGGVVAGLLVAIAAARSITLGGIRNIIKVRRAKSVTGKA